MTYIGNEIQWKQLMEIDWLGQYVKAWAAFNAWYRNSIVPPSGGKRLRDWQIIEQIKDDKGRVRSNIENFLSGTGLSNESFRTHVADLHKSLDAKVVTSSGKRIWMRQISDYHCVDPIEHSASRITYRIQIDVNQKKRIVTVSNSSGNEIFFKTINEAEELSPPSEKWFESLSSAQRKCLSGLLKISSPIHDLLSLDDSNPTEIGTLKFTSNKELIARSLIGILYQLRNALFHGEITPNEVREVYEPAYLILKQIIPGA